LSGACENEIEALVDQNVSQEYWPRVAQVKEKLGSLRFYVNGKLSAELREKISEAGHEKMKNSGVPHFS
jgi:hypothetical protein